MFLRKLLAAKPVRTPLEFGINDNIRITKIDNEPRKYEGELIKRNTFITFTKFDSKDEPMAASEFSFFNLDPERAEQNMENLANQVGILQNIIDVLNPGVIIDPTSEYKSFEAIEADLKSKKGCRSLQDTTWELFEAAVKDMVGVESPLVRIKVITDSKGKYLQLPREFPFLQSMESECTLSISAYELKCKSKALEATVEKADEKGTAPDGEKPKNREAIKNL